MTFELPPVPPKDPEARRALAERSWCHLMAHAAKAAAEGKLTIIPSTRPAAPGEHLRVQPEAPSKG